MSSWWGFIALLAVLFILARIAYPAKNQEGFGLKGKASGQPPSDTFIVATYNIQTGKDNNGKRNILGSANAITEADLIGIQEVYAPSWLNKWGLGKSQTEKLAKVGGFQYLFAATRFRWFREHRGNAILSKLKVKHWGIEMLPNKSAKSFRNMTVAQVEFAGEDFVFINTHLHTKKGRLKQLETVLAEFSNHPKTILVGDFNTTIDEPILADYLQNNPEVVDAVQHVNLSRDQQRIDWILTKGFEIIGGKSLPKGISDHPYFQVKVKPL